MPKSAATPPPFCREHLPPGTRFGLAVSGGADSVALLRAAHLLAREQGWVLRVLHLDHGLRGEQSAADVAFVEQLAHALEISCTVEHSAVAAAQSGLEDAGRLARSTWFARLLQSDELDAIATGHTLDDQAETVLAKLLRGAWTAGLGGIHPAVRAAELPGAHAGPANGLLVRPLLATRRAELRAWLAFLGQPWREDSSNQDLRFTRNRIRHQVLPALATVHPASIEHLAQTAELARDEENYWAKELARILPGLLLGGKPVRGGGRAHSTRPGEQTIGVEVERLRALAPALQRRLLRAIAARLGHGLDFAQTAQARGLLEGRIGSTARRVQLAGNLRLERTARELRFISEPGTPEAAEEILIPVPGVGAGFGVHLRLEHPGSAPQPPATLRAARPGDRVRLRYSSGAPKRIKELLERMDVPPNERPGWPVLEWQGEIVWVRGAKLEQSESSASLSVADYNTGELTP